MAVFRGKAEGAQTRMKDTQYIGLAVNKLRKGANMTLKELSDSTGLSQGFLSKFERGQTTIAVDSLLQIATALGTSIDHLLSQREQSADEAQGPKIIHRSYENSVLYMENNFINYQISDNYAGMDIFPKLIVLLPAQETDHTVQFAHKGQEFMYVLEGVLTVKIGSDTYDLFPGDTAHFKSDVQHTWYNNTNRNTMILTVHTPNVFFSGEPDGKNLPH